MKSTFQIEEKILKKLGNYLVEIIFTAEDFNGKENGRGNE